MLEVGSLVDGKYRILRVVGKGGMSVVYQAVNEKANKIWAIKEVRKDGVQNYEVVKQNLIVETELLKRFNHPNLPSIIDVIDGDGSFLIVMDYIEGNSLNKALETSGAQSQEDVIEWSKQLCDVLGYLHSRKPPIIYRDMKPANVMLKPDGNISLIDFGTAREFKSSSVEDTTCLGTQGYAAPEQYGGHGQTDARTDIYCLGATMYHLVTGHNPSTPPYEMYPIRQWNPMLSSGLEEIIIKCTQRNPNDRYQSCAELLYALDHYQDLDIENKKVQNFKWNTFIASVILTLAMLVGTFGFSIATSAMTSQTYSQLVKEADEISDGLKADYESTMQKPDAGKVAEAESKLVKAITDVDPANCDAYISLMNLYMANGKLDSTESSNLQKYISLNEDQIRSRNEKKYINELVCPLADNLFFCFNTTDKTGQIFSAKWYGKAADSDLTENKKRVEILSKLSANSKNEDAMDEKGDSAISTSEYWSLLQDLIKSESLSDTNIKIKLLIYRFAVNRLSEKTESWRTAVGGDISEQRYFETLDFIEQQVNEITSTELYKNNPSLERYVEDIKDVIEVSRATGFGYKVTGAVNTQEGAR